MSRAIDSARAAAARSPAPGSETRPARPMGGLVTTDAQQRQAHDDDAGKPPTSVDKSARPANNSKL